MEGSDEPGWRYMTALFSVKNLACQGPGMSLVVRAHHCSTVDHDVFDVIIRTVNWERCGEPESWN